MIDSRVSGIGALAVIAAFIGCVIFDAVSVTYEVPLPLYGLMGTILGGQVVLGLRRDDKKGTTTPDKSGETDGS